MQIGVAAGRVIPVDLRGGTAEAAREKSNDTVSPSELGAARAEIALC